MERDGERWREMERDGERWGEMERDGERWREMQRDGERWREMERDGERWGEMERDGERWGEMERDGERWREMQRDGERWREREREGERRRESERESERERESESESESERGREGGGEGREGGREGEGERERLRASTTFRSICSYRFPIIETSATALRSTTGVLLVYFWHLWQLIILHYMQPARSELWFFPTPAVFPQLLAACQPQHWMFLQPRVLSACQVLKQQTVVHPSPFHLPKSQHPRRLSWREKVVTRSCCDLPPLEPPPVRPPGALRKSMKISNQIISVQKLCAYHTKTRSFWSQVTRPKQRLPLWFMMFIAAAPGRGNGNSIELIRTTCIWLASASSSVEVVAVVAIRGTGAACISWSPWGLPARSFQSPPGSFGRHRQDWTSSATGSSSSSSCTRLGRLGRGPGAATSPQDTI